jgi:hypothetical protein
MSVAVHARDCAEWRYPRGGRVVLAGALRKARVVQPAVRWRRPLGQSADALLRCWLCCALAPSNHNVQCTAQLMCLCVCASFPAICACTREAPHAYAVEVTSMSLRCRFFSLFTTTISRQLLLIARGLLIRRGVCFIAWTFIVSLDRWETSRCFGSTTKGRTSGVWKNR